MIDKLPTEEEVVLLKKELNHILWTDAGENFVTRRGPVPERKFNMQCSSHAIITAAIFIRRGFAITTRLGEAVVLEPSADGNPYEDLLNHVAPHWWFSIQNHGLVDLSLFAQSGDPVVFCNRSAGGGWVISFGEHAEQVRRFVAARQRGCFYRTLSKREVSKADVPKDLTQPFPGARNAGVLLSFERIVLHCESLLAGSVESITSRPQVEAWKVLAERT